MACGALALGLLANAAPARAASMTMVARNTWTAGVSLPSYVQMYVYVPDKKAAKAPIVVSTHACGSTASGQFGNITKIRAAADKNGFIIIFPDNPGQNCWDVGSDKALMHDGGGDTQAIAQMVKYALTTYMGDPARVYIHGGSSGAMMTQGMLAVYPDVFRAGSARAGVAAGCWAVEYDKGGTAQWSVPCANGTVTHTAMEWGDMVRKMDPGYMGHRPRVQLFHGDQDTTIHFPNMAEGIKEWTNVLGLSTTPTTTDKGFKGAVATWDRQFWNNSCGYQVLEAWIAPGQGHSMNYEEDAILKFFGLDAAMDTDPEPECTGMGGGGASGGTATGGAMGTAGRSGAGGGMGAAGRNGGNAGATGTSTGGGIGMSSGGAQAAGSGGSGSGGAATGGASTSTGGSNTGGKPGSGGACSSSGGSNSSSSGGKSASGGSNGSGSGGSSASGGSAPPTGGSGSSGGCAIGGGTSVSASALGGLLLGLGLVVRRRRQPR